MHSRAGLPGMICSYCGIVAYAPPTPCKALKMNDLYSNHLWRLFYGAIIFRVVEKRLTHAELMLQNFVFFVIHIVKINLQNAHWSESLTWAQLRERCLLTLQVQNSLDD
ncbi:hypothetical protein K431DRAFT_21101 [Polychaeton citri CBS 116435]|uniref:Uncharacterized protein n=1 Tax=Polychaeton citri CBS 116435 TaxID=1314669 RepID=A0A9P4Q1C8_9PEZI|nr:hypothetical protein K431DRAFT_21101 [Polychaeton citri CBS 116435]